MPDPTPIQILTGFLGSGKTTWLAQLLRRPDMAGTAVIVNEFGEIGLDHDLIATADESIVQLTTGCLCCAASGDLARTLLDLAARREAATIPPFHRVVIETSGLADPAPILHAIMADPAVSALYTLHNVITLVDAIHGAKSLETHPEAQRQVAVADHILFSKTDRADPTPLHAQIAALNPSATIGTTAQTKALPNATPQDRPWMQWQSPPAQHTTGITTALILQQTPIPGAALALFLQALTTHAGPNLLRVKGLIDIAEMPGKPALIHGVQHVFAPPEWLETWPTPNHQTRLILIGKNIPPHWPTRLLQAIKEEVETTAPPPARGKGPYSSPSPARGRGPG